MEGRNTEDEQQAKYRLHYFRRDDIPVLSEDELKKESELIFNSLMPEYGAKRGFVRPLWYSAAATAALLLLVSGLYFFNNYKDGSFHNQTVKTTSGIKINDILPGSQSATLILADGNKIVLSKTRTGKIAEQNGMSITKTADGKLVYTANNLKANTTEFNTLSTVKGQQYQVILPDGSKVWLNAASSLTYPANFANLKDRMVQLSGEAYFEVAKDKSHPFIVKTDKQQVEVLGTHFNINSYEDERATTTTLLEGSVKVFNGKGESVLLPGQQSTLAKSKIEISKADVNETVAWKNGDFVFNNEEFGSILRQLSRWYNVDIVDNGQHENLHLSGTISRSKNISTVLKALEVTGEVKFKIEGKTVVVIK